MFKKITCENCGKRFDEIDQNCPACDEPNPNVPQKRRFGNKGLYVPFWMQITLFFVGWLGLQVLAIIFQLIAQLAGFEDVVRSAFVMFGAYTTLGIALLAISCTQIKKYLKAFKNWLVPIAGVIGLFAILAFNLTYNTILSILKIGVSDNANEQSVNSYITAYPVLSIIVIGLIGPLCEEITYRVGFYGFFRRINKYLAFALTMVVFALIHFDFGAFAEGGDVLINELLNLPFYLAAAFVFTFLFEKVGFGASFAAHASNNLLSVLSTLALGQCVIPLL